MLLASPLLVILALPSQDGHAESVRVLLGCSERYAQVRARELEVAPGDVEEAMRLFEEGVASLYPTVDESCSAARRSLLAGGPETAASLLAALAGLDLGTPEGMAAGLFGNTLLTELFGGGFEWVESWDAGAAASNGPTLARWKECFSAAEPGFWTMRGIRHSEALAQIDGFQFAECVLPAGASIRATTARGVIEVRAGHGFERHLTWNGATRSAILQPRRERWYGSLGLYFPGTGDHWVEHDGIVRGTLEEARIHLARMEDVEAWMREHGSSWVVRNDGLFVRFDRNAVRRQLAVEVWQIYVDGKKPTKIPGASDEAIVATGM